MSIVHVRVGVFNFGYRIGSDPKIRISETFGSGKLRSESDPKFSDIWTFWIGYRVFGSDHRIFRSGPLKVLENPDPYPIRKPEIFPGYPIWNIRNLKIGSDIRNFGSDWRIFGSDIFAHSYVRERKRVVKKNFDVKT